MKTGAAPLSLPNLFCSVRYANLSGIRYHLGLVLPMSPHLCTLSCHCPGGPSISYKNFRHIDKVLHYVFWNFTLSWCMGHDYSAPFMYLVQSRLCTRVSVLWEGILVLFHLKETLDCISWLPLSILVMSTNLSFESPFAVFLFLWPKRWFQRWMIFFDIFHFALRRFSPLLQFSE